MPQLHQDSMNIAILWGLGISPPTPTQQAEAWHSSPLVSKLKRDTQVSKQVEAWNSSLEASWSVAVNCVSNHPRTFFVPVDKTRARHLGNRSRRGRSCPRLALEHKYKCRVKWCQEFDKSLPPDWTTTWNTSPDCQGLYHLAHAGPGNDMTRLEEQA
jgi:hypothetical protein